MVFGYIRESCASTTCTNCADNQDWQHANKKYGFEDVSVFDGCLPWNLPAVTTFMVVVCECLAR